MNHNVAIDLTTLQATQGGSGGSGGGGGHMLKPVLLLLNNSLIVCVLHFGGGGGGSNEILSSLNIHEIPILKIKNVSFYYTRKLIQNKFSNL